MLGSRTSSSIKPGFFQLPPQSPPSILQGKFDYNQAFAAFLRATNQKKETANLVGCFARKLQAEHILLEASKVVKVADMGCADSATCLGYFDQMGETGGFEYTGVDINDKFLAEATAKLAAHPAVRKHTAIKGDVLMEGLAAVPKVEQQSFDLIFVSHLAYYLQDEHYSRLFVGNMLQLLNDSGIAVFLHEDSTHYFRSTYNSTYKHINAPELLRKSAAGLLKITAQFHEISFTSELTFEEMTEEQWEAAKNPSIYSEFGHTPGFVDNLNKLSFIVQCDLSKLHEEGGLSRFIDEMKTLLEDNHYCFKLATRMQTLVTAQNQHATKIGSILKSIEENLILEKAGPAGMCYS